MLYFGNTGSDWLLLVHMLSVIGNLIPEVPFIHLYTRVPGGVKTDICLEDVGAGFDCKSWVDTLGVTTCHYSVPY